MNLCKYCGKEHPNLGMTVIPSCVDVLIENLRVENKRLSGTVNPETLELDTDHPFYKETMEQVEDLVFLSKNQNSFASEQSLFLAARKLKYFARCFTLTANLLGMRCSRNQWKCLAEELAGCLDGLSTFHRHGGTWELLKIADKMTRFHELAKVEYEANRQIHH